MYFLGCSYWYRSRVNRYPVIYTNTDWWKTCTGNNAGFGATSPLWITHYANSVGTLPAGWNTYAFWQHATSGPVPGSQDLFYGDKNDLAL